MEKPLLNQKSIVENTAFDSAFYTKLFALPEKVLQFGTGVLLRGLPDYYIDKANKVGVFKGRIAVVKTTSHGEIESFKKQNFLYTHFMVGIIDNKITEKTIINTSISRVLQADNEWDSIVEIAKNPNTELIISNTTEQGLVYQQESILSGVPHSFPMKLLALLWARFQALGNSQEANIVIIPTELIEYNGDLLKKYVLAGAAYNQLSEDFVAYLNNQVSFCNSLVDRIVPGKPKKDFNSEAVKNFEFEDQYSLMSEPFGLWAIEGNEKVKECLSFAKVDEGVKIVNDISQFKELKLRLLNATHILSCGTAILLKIKTVKDGMKNAEFRPFFDNLILDIKKAFLIDIDSKIIDGFANSVAQRFENPYIEHYWESILLNYTTKMKIRAVPLLMNYYKKYGTISETMLQGFVSYFTLSIPSFEKDGNYYTEVEGSQILLSDEFSKSLFDAYQQFGLEKTIKNHLANTDFWGADFSTIPDFEEQIIEQIEMKIY